MDYIKDCWVYDYETPKGCFLASFSKVDSDEYIDFIINEKQNDLFKFIKFLIAESDKYFIGFNNITFDSQVTEYIWRNYADWYNLTGKEIAAKISIFAARVIDDSNYGLFPPYNEKYLSFKQIDCPRILHWFNENRRVSLKQAEVELRAENVENFEISPDKEDFTDKEIEDLIFYCHNDVRYTKEIYFHIIGQTTHPLYKGRNKVDDRINFEKEIGLPCLNWDDVKIGSEWNRLDYCAATGKKEDELKPKKVNTFFGKKYRAFFPQTVEFQTDSLKKFVYNELGDTTITFQEQKFEYKFSDDLIVTIARGGLHSKEKPRILTPDKGELFIQNDIGSQYPKAIIKYKAYPKHLGEEWVYMIVGKVDQRLYNKKKYKETKDPRYNSLQETGKYALNGGAYGKLGAPGDWQEDPCAMLTVTLGCQLEILMIVEGLYENGFNITSCNTDGWDAIIPEDRLDEYFEIVEYFEKKILADPGTVEFTVFDWMIQTSVNDYMAKKAGVFEKRKFKEDRIVAKESAYPDMKLKGDFTVDFELHKNSSFRIVPITLVEHFAKNSSVENTISGWNNIFDFCARSNSGSTYYHEGYSRDVEPHKLPKIIRYYVSDDGIYIKKMVKDNVETNANDQSVQPAEYKKVVCNRLPAATHQQHLEKVNRQFYIDKVNEIVYAIKTGKKPKRQKKDPNQLSMF